MIYELLLWLTLTVLVCTLFRTQPITRRTSGHRLLEAIFITLPPVSYFIFTMTKFPQQAFFQLLKGSDTGLMLTLTVLTLCLVLNVWVIYNTRRYTGLTGAFVLACLTAYWPAQHQSTITLKALNFDTLNLPKAAHLEINGVDFGTFPVSLTFEDLEKLPPIATKNLQDYEKLLAPQPSYVVNLAEYASGDGQSIVLDLNQSRTYQLAIRLNGLKLPNFNHLHNKDKPEFRINKFDHPALPTQMTYTIASSIGGCDLRNLILYAKLNDGEVPDLWLQAVNERNDQVIREALENDPFFAKLYHQKNGQLTAPQKASDTQQEKIKNLSDEALIAKFQHLPRVYLANHKADNDDFINLRSDYFYGVFNRYFLELATRESQTAQAFCQPYRELFLDAIVHYKQHGMGPWYFEDELILPYLNLCTPTEAQQSWQRLKREALQAIEPEYLDQTLFHLFEVLCQMQDKATIENFLELLFVPKPTSDHEISDHLPWCLNNLEKVAPSLQAPLKKVLITQISILKQSLNFHPDHPEWEEIMSRVQHFEPVTTPNGAARAHLNQLLANPNSKTLEALQPYLNHADQNVKFLAPLHYDHIQRLSQPDSLEQLQISEIIKQIHQVQ